MTANSHPMVSNLAKKSDDDVVIVCALRSGLQRAKKGLLKDTAPEFMLAEVIKGVVKTSNVDPKEIEDMVVGNVLMAGAGSWHARVA